MALLLYFVGNTNTSLTAHGDGESLEKQLKALEGIPEADRRITFKSFNPEAGGNKAVNITIFNPTVNLSHVIEEDDKVLEERIAENRKQRLHMEAMKTGGLIGH